MKYLFCDTIYPDAVPPVSGDDWREVAAQALATEFGTWTSWATAMTACGHDGATAVLNLPGDPFAEPWDVIHVQNIGYRPAAFWSEVRQRTGARLVGEFSHEAPSAGHLAQFDLLLTGFPHYARDFAAQGFPIRYLPLAFDPRRRRDVPRDLALTFVGGLGIGRHWQAGLHALQAVAEAFPGVLQWWGYRGSDLPCGSALCDAYQGPAWGRDYFDLLARSRITLNRHGEVHFDRGGEMGGTPPFPWACNMRLYEATGMGACLLTESSRNLGRETDGFPSLFEPGVEVLTWGNPRQLCDQIERALAHPEYVDAVAACGQKRCLAEHTFADRAAVLSEWLDG